MCTFFMGDIMKYNNEYMNMAYNEALKALGMGEVPVGCVIVKDNEIIAKGYNLKEKNKCIIDHAEMNCIKIASNKFDNWRLDGCDIYITLEPCPMCASAIKQARISNVYCGCSTNDDDSKFCRVIFEKSDRNNKVNFVSNLDSERCGKLIEDFFKKRRNN